MVTVRIIDSVEDVLFTVQFHPDHLAEFSRRGQIEYFPKVVNGKVYQMPTMRHTTLIEAINEMAL